MAVIATVSAGHDASYPFRQMGSADAGAYAARKGTSYYLETGEPPGEWCSDALAELGMRQGDEVERKPFEKIFGRFEDTRDPTGATYLGKPRRDMANAQVRYAQKLGTAGPGLTADQREQLWHQARAEATDRERAGVQYFDATMSISKDISLAHATALAEAKMARELGDLAGAATWEDRAVGIWQEIEHAHSAFTDYIQQNVRTVRVGHHGIDANGFEQGRFEDAGELAIARFFQTESRDGDPQLHIHTLILNRVKTIADDQWRAIDSRALYRARGAASAIAAVRLESALTQRFGWDWRYRDASKGRVIAAPGMDRFIRAFSSRRASIDASTAQLVDAFRADQGRDPNRRELRSLRQEANRETRKGKEGVIDRAAQLRRWQETSRRAELGGLHDVASAIWDGPASSERADPHGLSPEERRQLGLIALAEVQSRSAVWDRGALIASLQKHLPNGFTVGRAEDARPFLNELADGVLASGDVVRVDVGEWPRVPDMLRRADGESVYVRPGSARYATLDQLAAEQALVRRASAEAGPRLARDAAAQLLGADRAQLEAQLSGAGDGATITGSGLRLDQAAAAYHVLTSSRRGEVIIASAGAGKTFTAAQMARAWRDGGMGRVIGTALTSAGRNELHDAGVPEAFNLAELLGHLEGQRGARGAVDPGPDALIIVDETQMASLPDLSDLFLLAEKHDAKILTMGDHAQLESPAEGGGLGLLARGLGHARLQEPVRFAPGDFQRDASLLIRDGDTTGLQGYDEHGRLHGGREEQMTEQAAAMFVADHLADTDVILSAVSQREVAELSRRVQTYLRQAGLTHGPMISLKEGACAQAGDLVLARRNDKKITRSDGRAIANGDLMKITHVLGGRVTVQRMTGHDKQTGRRQWSAPYVIPAAYLAGHGELGYARTVATIEGKTSWTGITLTRDDRTRTSLYPALTRGRTDNHVFVYPVNPECEPGLEGTADPEVARRRMLEAQVRGQVIIGQDEFDPVPMLAAITGRDGSALSATEYRARELAGADHMARLWWMRLDASQHDAASRFTAAVGDALPADQAEEVLTDTDDLWRALRAAELAGIDGRTALSHALAAKDLTSAERLSAVLAWRVRQHAERQPTVGRFPAAVSDPALAEFCAELDQLMEEREARIGQHAAEHQPAWATRAFGPVPEDAAERAGWVFRAGRLGAYKELAGMPDSDPLGTRPATTFPERRAEYDRAAAVHPMHDGMDLAGLSEGRLLARRRGLETETAWAPPFVGRELGAAHRAADRYRLRAARHDQLAQAAVRKRDHVMAEAHARQAQQARTGQEKSERVIGILAGVHAARQDWDVVTGDTRRAAVAADQVLHERRLLREEDTLESREPQAFTYRTEQPSERDTRTMLGLDTVTGEVPEHVTRLAPIATAASERAEELRSMPEPDEDEDVRPSEAWDKLTERQRQSVLQRPEPELPPAEKVTEHMAEREAE